MYHSDVAQSFAGTVDSVSLGSAEAGQLAEATERFFSLMSAGQEVDLAHFAAQYPDIEPMLLDVLSALKIVGDGSHTVACSGSMATSSVDAGVRLGDFELIEEIGRGGMGVVYLARQCTLDRKVALKILPFLATLDPRRIKRFEHESQAVASLEHPHIVDVYSVGTEGGVHYYAMRYIDGYSLSERLNQFRLAESDGAKATRPNGAAQEKDTHTTDGANATTLPESLLTHGSAQQRFRAVAQIFIDVAHAIQHSHECGIVHRDIKPSNIMLDSSGKAWVTDFGLAQVSSSETLTMSNDLLGTLRYMAPEQLEVGQPIDHRIDIYSLGATLYEMLTLRALVEGQSHEAIIANIQRGIQLAPTRLQRQIPGDLERIVLKAVERAPENRFQTAGELGDDLQRWLDGLPVSARPIGRSRQVWRWCRKNRLIASLLCATMALLCAIAVGSTIVAGKFSRQNDLLATERDNLLQERRRAIGILSTITSGDAHEYIARRDGLTVEQEQLFAQLVDLFESYTTRMDDTRQERMRQANVYQRMGTLLADIGRSGEAIDAYRKSIDIHVALIAEAPSDALQEGTAKVERKLAIELFETLGRYDEAEELIASARSRWDSLVNLTTDQRFWAIVTRQDDGEIQAKLGNWEAAITILESVRVDLQALSEGSPGKADFARQYAHVCYRLGVISCELSDFEEADQYFIDGIRTCEQLVVAGRGGRAIRQQLGDLHSMYGSSLRHQDRFRDSEAHHRRAVATFDRLVADFPNIRGMRSGLESSKNNLAIILTQTGQLREAVEHLMDVTESIRRRANTSPENIDLGRSLVSTLANTGRVLELASKYDRAMEYFEQGDALVSTLLEKHTRDDKLRLLKRDVNWSMARIMDCTGRYHEATAFGSRARKFDDRGLPDILAGMALNQARLGELDSARREAERLVATQTSDREVLFDCARIYALCASESRTDEARAEYHNLAFDLLEQAADSNFRLPDLAEEEPSFAELTAHPRFLAFIERVKANAAPKH